MMKWQRTHRKGTKQPIIMHTNSGFTPSSAYLDSYFEYRARCEAVNITPATCKEYYYDREGHYDELIEKAKQST